MGNSLLYVKTFTTWGHFNLFIQQILTNLECVPGSVPGTGKTEVTPEVTPAFQRLPYFFEATSSALLSLCSLCCDVAFCWVTVCPCFSPEMSPRLQVWSHSCASRVSRSENCVVLKRLRSSLMFLAAGSYSGLTGAGGRRDPPSLLCC